jgi:hypothetical protein
MSAGLAIDELIDELTYRLSRLERQSGFPVVWRKKTEFTEAKFDLDTYSQLSREIHHFLQDLAGLKQDLDDVEEFLSVLMKPIPRWKAIITNNNSFPLNPALERSDKIILEGAYVIQQRRKAVASSIIWLDRRAQNTLNLVSKSFPSEISILRCYCFPHTSIISFCKPN